MRPLLTLSVHEQIRTAVRAGQATLECSVDLDRSTVIVELHETTWSYDGQSYPYLETCKPRTIYYWGGDSFQVASRFRDSLIKLVPTQWGTPTFEIDGIKMLVSESISPYADAERKVGLIEPRGKIILDTCGGLGYFAAWCLQQQAAQILSYEKNPDVVWLRTLNPWSPQDDARLSLTTADIVESISSLANDSVDAALHDPPRFGIAGELYSLEFYEQLARVLKKNGKLFHYTGAPNKLTSGRDVPNEVATRLRRAGFSTQLVLDGVLAVRKKS